MLILWLMGLTFSHIFLQTAAIFLWVLFFHPKFFRRRFQGEEWILMGLFLVSVMGVLRAGSYPIVQALPGTMPFLILVAAVFMRRLCQHTLQEKAVFWIWTFILFSSIPALTGIVQHGLGAPRSAGVYGGIYNLSILMAVTLPVGTGLFLKTRRLRGKGLLVFILTSHFLALWYTATRAAFLAVLFGMGLWCANYLFRFLRFPKDKHLLQNGLTISIIPLTLILMILSSDDYRINPFFNPPSEYYTSGKGDLTTYRLGIIKDAWHILQTDIQDNQYAKVLWGHGIYSRKRLVPSVHISWQSDYLQVLMDMGLIGLILLIWLYKDFLRTATRKWGHPEVLYQAFAWSALGYFLMSFLTLQVTGLYGAGVFSFLYAFLKQD